MEIIDIIETIEMHSLEILDAQEDDYLTMANHHEMIAWLYRLAASDVNHTTTCSRNVYQQKCKQLSIPAL